MNLEVSTRAFPAERSVLPEIRRLVEAEARRHDFSDPVGDLQLAVTEACSNAIVHSGTHEIRVSINQIGTCLQITIEDDGVYDQVLPVPETDGRGHRGLHLMAAVVDDFSLRRGTNEERGTVVRLLKCSP